MTDNTAFKSIQHLPAAQIELPRHEQNRRESKNLSHENAQLKKQNELLKKELENFNSKLDGELHRHITGSRKPKSKREDVESMQLKNAYKQGDIYKKEAHFYKRRLAMIEEREKSQEAEEWKGNSLERQNAKLRQEVSYLMKINKRQEKGLEAADIQGYLGNSRENQRLQSEIRRLKRQIDQLQKGSSSQASDSRIHGLNKNTTISQRQKFYHHNPSRLRIRSEIRDMESDPEVAALRERIEKDQIRMKVLKQQRDKLREQVNKYRDEVEEKSKEIAVLKEKIDSLRGNNMVLQRQLQSKKGHNHTKSNSLQGKLGKKQKATPSSRHWSISKLQANTAEKPTVKKDPPSNQNIYKWSHQIFASKMLELHLVIHPKGHIQDIHAKYEKGQPKLYNYLRNKSCQSLVCRDGQYIKHLSGCFSEGLLQFLTALTSDGRLETFGNGEFVELNEGGQRFEFELQVDGKYGILFGETSDSGVTKLGCLMVKV